MSEQDDRIARLEALVEKLVEHVMPANDDEKNPAKVEAGRKGGEASGRSRRSRTKQPASSRNEAETKQNEATVLQAPTPSPLKGEGGGGLLEAPAKQNEAETKQTSEAERSSYRPPVVYGRDRTPHPYDPASRQLPPPHDPDYKQKLAVIKDGYARGREPDEILRDIGVSPVANPDRFTVSHNEVVNVLTKRGIRNVEAIHGAVIDDYICQKPDWTPEGIADIIIADRRSNGWPTGHSNFTPPDLGGAPARHPSAARKPTPKRAEPDDDF